jgi:hypothetical protein
MAERAPGRTVVLYAMVGDVYIVVNGEVEGRAQEWEAHVSDLREKLPLIRGILAHSTGGAPDGRTRALLGSILGGAQFPVSVMTSSSLARGVVTALNWFLRNRIKAFAPRDFAGALTYLGVDARRGAAIERKVHDLRRELGLPSLDAGGDTRNDEP